MADSGGGRSFGSTVEAIEGPLGGDHHRGKRRLIGGGGFHPIDTAGALDVPFKDTATATPLSPVKSPTKVVAWDFGGGVTASDFFRSVNADPDIKVIRDAVGCDESMRYKKPVRRVSVVSRVDFLSTSGNLSRRLPTGDSSSSLSSTPAGGALLLLRGGRRKDSHSRLHQPDETQPLGLDEGAAAVVNAVGGGSATRSGRRRQSILEHVEVRGLSAATPDLLTQRQLLQHDPQGIHHDPHGDPVASPSSAPSSSSGTAGWTSSPPYTSRRVSGSQEDHEESQPGGGGLVNRVLNSWFFRNQEVAVDDGGDLRHAQLDGRPVEGIGGGVLTSKVVSALGLEGQSPNESRKMNAWMPQSL